MRASAPSVAARLILVPAQELHQPGHDGVRLPRVPVVVETPDHQFVLRDERLFEFVDRIVDQFLGLVQVTPERRLVRHDQVLARSGSTLQHVQRGHETRGDASHGRIRIAGLERVHRLLTPRNADVFLDALDGLAGRQRAALRLCRCPARQDTCGARNKGRTDNHRIARHRIASHRADSSPARAS